jgi:cobalamin 5'-phosphate synthase/cobalamin synthase
MNMLSKFLAALSFVTCLPLCRDKVDSEQNPEVLGGLSAYLPAVGFLLGGLLLAVYALLKALAAPAILAAVSLWLIWLLLTGGIHFDGLMDTADGIFSHRSRERMLEIMKDSRSGNFGVVAALSVVLLKCSALCIVFDKSAWFMLLLVPTWSRWCETFTIGAFEYLRDAGMGKIWHETTKFPRDVLIACMLPVSSTAIMCFVAHSWLPLATAVCCLFAGIGVALFIRQLLGGHTGDTYGCVVEVAEAGGLFCAAFAIK